MNIKQMTDTYAYTTAEPDRDKYGDLVLKANEVGVIDMAIYLHTQSTTDDIRFQNADYIGLTNDTVNDQYIIYYHDERLKVMYVNPFGRYKQVFMQKI